RPRPERPGPLRCIRLLRLRVQYRDPSAAADGSPRRRGPAGDRDGGEMSAHHGYDVAIIGCGPVGEILSIVLAQHGVRSVAIEREPGIYSTPRAGALDDEVM